VRRRKWLRKVIRQAQSASGGTDGYRLAQAELRLASSIAIERKTVLKLAAEGEPSDSLRGGFLKSLSKWQALRM
jgi:hypothetical protein